MPIPTLARNSVVRYEMLSRHFHEILKKNLEGERLSKDELDYLLNAVEFFDELFLALGVNPPSKRAASTLGVVSGAASESDLSLFYTVQALQSRPGAPSTVPGLRRRLEKFRSAIHSVCSLGSVSKDRKEAVGDVSSFFQNYNKSLHLSHTL